MRYFTRVTAVAAALLLPISGFAAQRAGGGGGGGGGSGAHVGGGGGGGGRMGGGGGGGRAFGGGGGGRVGGGRVGGGYVGGGHTVGGHIAAPNRNTMHYASPGANVNSKAVHNVNPNAGINSKAAHNANPNANFNSKSGNTNPNANVNFKAVHTNPNANVTSNSVHNALNSRSVAGALRNTSALHNPHTRALITASAATAGWRHGREGEDGWWRHRNGGYGWVGPLFWPFAYYDMYDYALWGYGYDDSFWNYGYDDIYAGIFVPYGYNDLTGYLPQSSSRNPSGPGQASPVSATPNATANPLAQLCGEDSRDIAGLPVDQFQRAIQPDDAQRAALDDLANASVKAARDIKAACPTEIALTAPTRLAAMQKRIEAMIGAVETVQPPLEKFYGLLSDEQKERVTALGQEQRQSRTASSPDQSCGAAQASVTDWPTADIERTVRPTDAQRESLVALQNATAKAADMLKVSCPADNPLTPPARLAAVGKRLDTMLQAVKTVIAPLNDFYGALDDEQKARFDAIAPQRTSQIDQPKTTQTHARQRSIPDIGIVIRHMLRFF
jgi:hypothetical protein